MIAMTEEKRSQRVPENAENRISLFKISAIWQENAITREGYNCSQVWRPLAFADRAEAHGIN